MEYQKFVNLRELFFRHTTGQYRHFKGGLYFVEDLAYHTETEEPMVIYRNSEGVLFSRPYYNFFSEVDGQKRFTKVSIYAFADILT